MADLLPATLHLVFAAVLVYVSFTDLKQRIVPNRVIFPSLALALAFMFYTPGWQPALIGGAIAALALVLPVLLYGPDRAGIGDVKLGLFIGLVLGYPGVMYALALSFGAAALVSVIGLLLRRMTRRTPIPFAPFLAFGALVVLFLPAI
ncbi:MAG: A24 family peptidase [Bacteroidetes bacterium]|nr:A24 family peptidase [Bacteroidota bacterium]